MLACVNAWIYEPVAAFIDVGAARAEYISACFVGLL